MLLISGMDFSGKTSVAKRIIEVFPNTYKIQHKYLSISDPLKDIRNKKKYPVDEWVLFWKQVILNDISEFKRYCQMGRYNNYDSILQDGLSAFKHLAMLKANANNTNNDSLVVFEEALHQYPSMDSIFLTASIEERKKRYEMRKLSKRTYSDHLLFSSQFSKIEDEYKKIILNYFPHTLIIDTSTISVNEVAKIVINQFEKRDFGD